MRNESKRLAWLLVFPTLLACSKETKPVAEDAKAPTAASSPELEAQPAGAAEAKAPPVQATAEPAEPGQDSVSEASFDLTLQPSGSYQVGQSGTVEIVLDAKAPYHVNKDYPYSFQLKESEGVSFPEMKVKKNAVELEERKARMKVGFTPQAAGERTIAGTFKFSVCTEEQCLIKKHDLALAVEVK